MSTLIPSISEYQLVNGKFVVKSKVSKGIKIGLVIGLIIGGIFATDKETSSHVQDIPRMVFDSTQYRVQRIVDYIQKKNPSVTDDDARAIAKSTMKWSDEFKLDANLILAVQEVESTFNKHSISSAGALGIMQVIPSWHLNKLKTAIKDVGTPELFNIDSNIYLGSWVLKDCISKYNLTKSSLLCYNGSNASPNGYDQKVLTAYGNVSKFMKGAT